MTRTLAGQLELLAGSYADTDCIVITCGPSLADVPVVPLRRALRGKLALTVKHAVQIAGSEADFLCFNSFNVTRFKTESKSTIRLVAKEPSGRYPQLNRVDLTLRQGSGGGDLSRSLAVTGRFADYPLGDGGPRPWGPGIMYETVLHLALHLGVRRITTLGWDIANLSGENVHFYDQGYGDSTFARGRNQAPAPPAVRRRMPGVVLRGARLGRTVVAHARGTTYNQALPVVGETAVVSAATSAVHEWLTDNGVVLEVVTPSAHLDPAIPRLTIAEFLERTGD